MSLYSIDGFCDVSVQSGTSLYPFCFVSNHLPKSERHKPEHCRFVALLDPSGFPKTEMGKRSKDAYRQAWLDKILLPIETIGYEGIISPDAAGVDRLYRVEVECFDVDHPEAAVLACVKQDRCERCLAQRCDFSNFHDPVELRCPHAARACWEAFNEAKVRIASKEYANQSEKAQLSAQARACEEEANEAGFHLRRNRFWYAPDGGDEAYNNLGWAELHNVKGAMADLLQNTLDVLWENDPDGWLALLAEIDKVLITYGSSYPLLKGCVRWRGLSGLLSREEKTRPKVKDFVKM